MTNFAAAAITSGIWFHPHRVSYRSVSCSGLTSASRKQFPLKSTDYPIEKDVGRVSVRVVATKVGTDSKADIWTQNLVNTLTFEDVASSDKTDVLSLTFEDVTSLDPKVASSGQKTWKKEMNPKRLNSSASQIKKALQFSVIKYPLGTEAAIKLMLERNTLVFVVDKHADKNDIKDNVKKMFNVRAKKVNTSITPDGTKKAFIMLAPEFKASDIAKKIKIL